MAISRHKFLGELESEVSGGEPDPMLEIKHLHRAIDERAERFRRTYVKTRIQTTTTGEI